jgi:hypothetical protein
MAASIGPGQVISLQAAIASLRKAAPLHYGQGKALYPLIFMALTGRAHFSISPG